MKIVCINADGYYLIVGNIYEVEYETSDCYYIRNDIGRMSFYPKNRFKEYGNKV